MRWMIVSVAAILAAAAAMAQDAPPIARPIGNPGAWIPENAYPPGARSSGEEGRVAFTLVIDETGRATDCKVTTSSESPLLDETTCTLMVANGRFTPPRDKKGKPVESRWSSSVRWKLETPPPPPVAPGSAPSAAPAAAKP